MSLPNFVDDFSVHLSRNAREYEVNLGSAVNPSLPDVADKFPSYWIADLPPVAGEVAQVLAVDGSYATMILRNGGILYLVRGACISCDGLVSRKMLGGIVAGRHLHIRRFVGLLSELLEIECALEGLEKTREAPPRYLLIDGSLLSRALHIPIEYNLYVPGSTTVNPMTFDLPRVPGTDYPLPPGAISLRFLEAFLDLISVAKSQGTVLVGVSKDSSTSIFHVGILDDLVEEQLQALKDPVLAKELRDVIFSGEPWKRLEKVKKICARRGVDPVNVSSLEVLLKEYKYVIPDCSIVQAFAKDVGFTKPLVAGAASARHLRRCKQIMKDASRYVKKEFTASLQETDSAGCRKDFEKYAISMVERFPRLPAVAVSHTKLEKNDAPIRVDVFAHDFVSSGSNSSLHQKILADLPTTEWSDPTAEFLELLSFLRFGHCGTVNHNIWLTAVDGEVRLTSKSVENCYLPYIAQIIGKHLSEFLGRRERRARQI